MVCHIQGSGWLPRRSQSAVVWNGWPRGRRGEGCDTNVGNRSAIWTRIYRNSSSRSGDNCRWSGIVRESDTGGLDRGRRPGEEIQSELVGEAGISVPRFRDENILRWHRECGRRELSRPYPPRRHQLRVLPRSGCREILRSSESAVKK